MEGRVGGRGESPSSSSSSVVSAPGVSPPNYTGNHYKTKGASAALASFAKQKHPQPQHNRPSSKFNKSAAATTNTTSKSRHLQNHRSKLSNHGSSQHNEQTQNKKSRDNSPERKRRHEDGKANDKRKIPAEDDDEDEGIFQATNQLKDADAEKTSYTIAQEQQQKYDDASDEDEDEHDDYHTGEPHSNKTGHLQKHQPKKMEREEKKIAKQQKCTSENNSHYKEYASKIGNSSPADNDPTSTYKYNANKSKKHKASTNMERATGLSPYSLKAIVTGTKTKPAAKHGTLVAGKSDGNEQRSASMKNQSNQKWKIYRDGNDKGIDESDDDNDNSSIGSNKGNYPAEGVDGAANTASAAESGDEDNDIPEIAATATASGKTINATANLDATVPSSLSMVKRWLPLDYEPSPFDVICGRGRGCYLHAGNTKFRSIVESYVDEYATYVNDKFAKIEIVSEVLERVQNPKLYSKKTGLKKEQKKANLKGGDDASPNGNDKGGVAEEESSDDGAEQTGGCFLRKDPASDQWFEISDIVARDKISSAFRDLVHERYSPSDTASRKRQRQSQGDDPAPHHQFPPPVPKQLRGAAAAVARARQQELQGQSLERRAQQQMANEVPAEARPNAVIVEDDDEEDDNDVGKRKEDDNVNRNIDLADQDSEKSSRSAVRQDSSSPNQLLSVDFEPSPEDVLLSNSSMKIHRQDRYGEHPGNISFHALVKTLLPTYTNVRNNTERLILAQRVLDQIWSRGGKFLKRDIKSGRWVQVPDSVALTKSSQVFEDSVHSSDKRTEGSGGGAPVDTEVDPAPPASKSQGKEENISKKRKKRKEKHRDQHHHHALSVAHLQQQHESDADENDVSVHEVEENKADKRIGNYDAGKTSTAVAAPEQEDDSKNIATLEIKAHQGDRESQYKLAIWYKTGQYVRGDENNNFQAGPISSITTSAGIAKSQHHLEHAAFWLEKAAYQGHVHAQFELASCYHMGGQGVPQNLATAVHWYCQAAAQYFFVLNRNEILDLTKDFDLNEYVLKVPKIVDNTTRTAIDTAATASTVAANARLQQQRQAASALSLFHDNASGTMTAASVANHGLSHHPASRHQQPTLPFATTIPGTSAQSTTGATNAAGTPLAHVVGLFGAPNVLLPQPNAGALQSAVRAQHQQPPNQAQHRPFRLM